MQNPLKIWAQALATVQVTLASVQKQLTAIALTQNTILGILQTQQKELTNMALDITALQTAVANETTVEQSAITLMTGLAAKISALIASSGNTVDPVALQAIVDGINQNQAALAAAVAANTPAAA
jgi:hypothetical protein